MVHVQGVMGTHGNGFAGGLSRPPPRLREATQPQESSRWKDLPFVFPGMKRTLFQPNTRTGAGRGDWRWTATGEKSQTRREKLQAHFLSRLASIRSPSLTEVLK